jgi:hypothetical protein
MRQVQFNNPTPATNGADLARKEDAAISGIAV